MAETTVPIADAASADHSIAGYTKTVGATTAFVQEVDLNGSGGTAFSTAGKVDVKAAAGDITQLSAAAASIAKAEDVASADADVGVPAMAIRKATPANTSGTDGDYEMLQVSAGRLWASATIDAALPAGSNVIGHVINDAGSAVIGHVIVDAGTAAIGGTFTNASTSATGVSLSYQSALTNVKADVKTSAGLLHGWHIYNPNAAVTYIRLYALADANVTANSTTPTMVLVVPAQGWLDSPPFPLGIAFANSITVLAATTASSTATAPTNTLVATFFYI